MDFSSMGRLYSLKEMAKITDVPKSTLERWIKTIGLRPHDHLARGKQLYLPEDLEMLSDMKAAKLRGPEAFEKFIRTWAEPKTVNKDGSVPANVVEGIQKDISDLKLSQEAMLEAILEIREELRKKRLPGL